ncbi:hypothetical protein VitviT2T_023508 [Vitis vinifera]|uniref:LOB domain-containing protein 31 n=2 Tax=Vitis vinifera TaxID=29760 RepID=D7U7T1_VITVI|eukprot:XP_002273687.2 PREDICTED: LOB domain-containing protein 19 [Vitis vinifera]
MTGSKGDGGGPCGACKFLRRKCVKGCVFAPYFDSDQGTAHFAAVHKVFGASNASKLLTGIPAHKRLDAVVTLCYEALARLRDPVYGCVAHVFTLQQQVMNLQAELAFIQARLSTLQRIPSLAPPPLLPESAPQPNLQSDFFNVPLQSHEASMEAADFCNNSMDRELEDGDLQTLAQEFVSRFLPGVKVRDSSSN